MAFDFNSGFKPFEKKLWLSSSTMHGEEIEYIDEASSERCLEFYKLLGFAESFRKV